MSSKAHLSVLRGLPAAALLLALAPAAAAQPLAVRGQVANAMGAPLVGAPVALLPLPTLYEAALSELEGRTAPEPLATDRTGESGRFTLVPPASGVYRVVVHPRGAAPFEYSPVAVVAKRELPPLAIPAEGSLGPPSHGWRAVRQPAPASPAGLRGIPRRLQVRAEDGGALAGAVLVCSEGRKPLAQTSPEGIAELPGDLPPGAELELLLPDGGLHRLALPAGSGPLTVAASATGTVTGRVLAEPEPRPLGGALVWAGDDPGRFRLADEAGRFELPLHGPGSWVQAEAPGFVPGQEAARPEGGGLHLPPLVLRRPATLQGELLDPDGRPVPGALVAAFDLELGDRRAFRRPDAADEWAKVGPTGDFVFRSLIPGRRYLLSAEKEGYEPESVELAAPSDARRAPLTLVMRPRLAARGRVVDADARAVSGATVRLHPAGLERPRRENPDRARERSPFAGVTDASGSFRIRKLPAETVDVEVRAPGFAELRVRGVDLGRQGDLGTLVLSPGLSLAGRVVDEEGRGVEKARIWMLPREPSARSFDDLFPGLGPDAESAGNGRFTLAGLEPGRTVHLLAHAEGYVPATLGHVSVEAGDTLELVLERGASLAGRVVDPSGEPVPGARVRANAHQGPNGVLAPGTLPPEALAGAQADDQGRFTFRALAPGAWQVEAQARGFQRSRPEVVEVAGGEERRGLRLVLAPGAALEGEVRTPDGAPVPGARITAGPEAAATDAEGRFLLDGLAPGPQTVQAWHAEMGARRRQVHVEPGRNRVDFTLEPGARVSGRVVDDAGAEVVGASVYLAGGAEWHEYAAVTDESGAFELARVAPGPYKLSARKEGHASAELPGGVVVGEAPVDRLEVVLPPGTVASGLVLGLSSEELSRVAVTAEDPTGESLRGIVSFDGSYAVRDLRPGRWRLRASLDDGRREAAVWIDVEAGARQLRRDLELRPGLTLTGQVSLNGAPLAGAHVAAVGPDGMPRATVADRRGAFRLEGLEPGNYRVEASSSRELVVDHRVVQLDRDREVLLDVRTARVGGRVVTRDGEPLADALVVLHPAGPREAGILTVGTDSSGGFRFERVAAGSYRLSARRSGDAAPPRDLEVGADLEGLELRLEPAAGTSPDHPTPPPPPE